jgi:hypothetical protein
VSLAPTHLAIATHLSPFVPVIQSEIIGVRLEQTALESDGQQAGRITVCKDPVNSHEEVSAHGKVTEHVHCHAAMHDMESFDATYCRNNSKGNYMPEKPSHTSHTYM